MGSFSPPTESCFYPVCVCVCLLSFSVGLMSPRQVIYDLSVAAVEKGDIQLSPLINNLCSGPCTPNLTAPIWLTENNSLSLPFSISPPCLYFARHSLLHSLFFSLFPFETERKHCMRGQVRTRVAPAQVTGSQVLLRRRDSSQFC